MLNICICDDDPIDCEKIRKTLELYSFQKNVDMEVRVETDPDELLRGPLDYEFILLDIRFDKEDKGIDVGIQLRNLKYKGIIIFISVYSRYAIPGYMAEPFRYVVKPVREQEMFKVMDAAIKKLHEPETRLMIKSLDGKIIVELSKLLYIEGADRHRQVTMLDHTFLTSTKLKEFYEILPKERFAYPQKGFIVNYSYVRKIYNKAVHMINDRAIPLGRKYTKAFMLGVNIFIKNS